MIYPQNIVNCRNSIYSEKNRKFLISNIASSEQADDLTLPPNCNGYGRIHHFKRHIEDWGDDPLPMDPACKALNLEYTNIVKTQVFQIAACNLKCWYCFVLDSLKCSNAKMSTWMSAEDLIDLFIKEDNKVRIIDLSGGNPELSPEWIIDVMKALEKKE